MCQTRGDASWQHMTNACVPAVDVRLAHKPAATAQLCRPPYTFVAAPDSFRALARISPRPGVRHEHALQRVMGNVGQTDSVAAPAAPACACRRARITTRRPFTAVAGG